MFFKLSSQGLQKIQGSTTNTLQSEINVNAVNSLKSLTYDFFSLQQVEPKSFSDNGMQYVWQRALFQQFMQILIYWPICYGRVNNQIVLPHWLAGGICQKKADYSLYWQWKSELLIKIVSRNINIILYTPRLWALEDKFFFCSWLSWNKWQKTNASKLLYIISTGRCGFRPFETKSFIAGDTTVRAALWLVSRNLQKLTPLKLHLAGQKHKIKAYWVRIKLLHQYCTIDDHTPVPFNGCILLHIPRKRFRYHEYNVQKMGRYQRQFYQPKHS